MWFIPYTTRNGSANHPATFPVELPERCIKLHGLGERGIVLDPFGGIGATSLAAQRCGVSSICIEMDEHYCRLAEERPHIVE